MTNSTTGSQTQTLTTDEYVTAFDGNREESITTTVAVAIAEATGQDVMDIPPIGSYVDCEAFDTLLESADSTLSISFNYEDRRVFVTGDGRIEVTKRNVV